MARLFLVRHGKADATGAVYDRLTDIGHRQADLFARYIQSAGLRADAIYSGTMERQKDTASYLAKYTGLTVSVTPRLNEFLPGFWRATAEEIARADEAFRRDLERYLAIRTRGDFRSLALFLRQTERIMHEWRGGLTATDCESFVEFRERVHSILDEIRGRSGCVFVFSSGTPLSLMIANLLEMKEERFFDWMRILYNTSLSVFTTERGRFLPVTVNTLPHLPDRSLHTLL
jgi:broad specificity phosphatase PhoE